MNVGVLDHAGMLDLLGRLSGRRLLGVVDCGDCIEVVFDDAPQAGNLVTLYTNSGSRTGLVAFGFVSDPDAYVADWHRWLEEAA